MFQEKNVKELWENYSYNTGIILVTEWEQSKEQKKYLTKFLTKKVIRAENFPKLMTDTKPQIHEAQR